MSDLTLTKTRIQAGTYEGVLKSPDGAGKPDIAALFQENPVGELSVLPDEQVENCWNVRLAIPADVLTDGVQTFLIVDAGPAGQVTVRTDGDTPLKEGEKIGLIAPPDRVHFFGADGLAL